MRTVTVTAIADFSYLGQDVKAGEGVEMRPIEALAAQRQGHVSLTKTSARHIQRRDLEPEQTADATPTTRRRTYRRRDLVPEP